MRYVHYQRRSFLQFPCRAARTPKTGVRGPRPIPRWSAGCPPPEAQPPPRGEICPPPPRSAYPKRFRWASWARPMRIRCARTAEGPRAERVAPPRPAPPRPVRPRCQQVSHQVPPRLGHTHAHHCARYSPTFRPRIRALYSSSRHIQQIKKLHIFNTL